MKESDVHDVYYPDEGRPLTDALFEAIETARGEDIRDASFQMCDDVDPDALDRLLGDGADSRTVVRFTTDDVRVKLRGEGVVDIWVRRR